MNDALVHPTLPEELQAFPVAWSAIWWCCPSLPEELLGKSHCPPALSGVGVDGGFLNLQLNLLMLLSTEVLVDPFFFSSFPVRTFQC